MDAKQQSQQWLLILLVINIVITAFHYTDNFLHFEHYPAPAWITQQGVWIAWLVLTIIGIIGYFLYIKQAFWAAYLCLVIYSITGGFSPGHYFFPAIEPFSFKMHAFIWLDAVVGFSVFGFVLWSALLTKEWQLANMRREL